MFGNWPRPDARERKLTPKEASARSSPIWSRLVARTVTLHVSTFADDDNAISSWLTVGPGVEARRRRLADDVRGFFSSRSIQVVYVVSWNNGRSQGQPLAYAAFSSEADAAAAVEQCDGGRIRDVQTVLAKAHSLPSDWETKIWQRIIGSQPRRRGGHEDASLVALIERVRREAPAVEFRRPQTRLDLRAKNSHSELAKLCSKLQKSLRLENCVEIADGAPLHITHVLVDEERVGARGTGCTKSEAKENARTNALAVLRPLVATHEVSHEQSNPYRAHISGLPKSTTDESLLEGLQAAADGVLACHVVANHKKTDLCRGFGFATLETQEKLDTLIAKLDGKPGLGSESDLTVSAARRGSGGPTPAKSTM